jgi:hypothetical protein
MLQYLVTKHKYKKSGVGMDIQPTSQQPISDDQELAKVLAGITAGADGATSTDLASSLEQDTVAAPATGTDSNQGTSPTGATTPDPIASPVSSAPTPAPASAVSSFSLPSSAPAVDSGLEAIKNDALKELRPLVDKLNLSAEEKFDTYLLLIRSTDDTTLISPAFTAARGITDESEKAQALLDIVKEIDYLSNPQKQDA